MSNVEGIRQQLTALAHDADTLIHDLYQRQRVTLRSEQSEIKNILGGSDTEVDVAMVNAIDGAVNSVETARKLLAAFAAGARNRRV